ncbi:MAG: hypothetical protein AB7V42_13305 [Thermoleophilia bacterium]
MAVPERLGGVRRAWPAAAAAVLTLVTWPVRSLTPGVGLDQSWHIALHLAADQRIAWGPDLVFSYGPLGFLDVPELVVSGLLTSLALTWTALLVFLTSLAIILAARRSFPWPVGVILALVFGCLAFQNQEYIALAAFLWAALAIGGDIPPRSGPLMVAASGVLAAAGVLVKVNSGAVALVVLAVAAWWLRPLRWRALALYASSAAATFLVLWVAVVGSPAYIPSWLRGSLQIAGGFSGAMFADEGDRGWEIPAFIVLVAALAALVWLWGDGRLGRGRSLCLAAIAAVFGFTSFKHGFVRHDFGHSPFTLLCLMVAPVAFAWRGAARASAALALVVAGGLVAARSADSDWSPPFRTLFDPVGHVRDAVDQARLMASGARRDGAIARTRADFAAGLAVPHEMIARIGDGTVHVDPYETSVVFAYGLRWRPVPTLQAYDAVTRDLDGRAAAFVSGAHAPEWIIDQVRARVWSLRRETESPEYQVAVICHYRAVEDNGAWRLLRRTANRCGPARPLASTEVRSAGQTVEVPAPPSPGDLVYARFDAPTPLGWRLRNALYRPARMPTMLVDGQVFARFPLATAAGSFPLRVPATVGFGPDYGIPRAARAIVLADLPRPFRVTFFSVPVAR